MCVYVCFKLYNEWLERKILKHIKIYIQNLNPGHARKDQSCQAYYKSIFIKRALSNQASSYVSVFTDCFRDLPIFQEGILTVPLLQMFTDVPITKVSKGNSYYCFHVVITQVSKNVISFQPAHGFGPLYTSPGLCNYNVKITSD